MFASCSVDGTIAIWDTRLGKSAATSFKAHNADVNVISWNRCLIVLVFLYLEILACIIFYVLTSFGTSLILLGWLAVCWHLDVMMAHFLFAISDCLRYPLSDLRYCIIYLFFEKICDL